MTMKRTLPALVALAALATGPVLAADLPVRRAAPPPPAFFSWTGCYVGGHLGALWARKEWTERTPESGEFFGADEDGHNSAGFVGGAQAGCDLQLGGFVIGFAGDYGFSDAQGDHDHPFYIGFAHHSRVESLASVTARLGLAWGRFLAYVKGGGAWEEDEYEIWELGEFVSGASESRSGWTVGIGGEYAVTDFLSAFIEYNYYGFGTRELSFFTADGFFDSTHDIKETKSVLKVGLNLRFGGWGAPPVMARY
jgi:outer membrane immunogenic protein